MPLLNVFIVKSTVSVWNKEMEIYVALKKVRFFSLCRFKLGVVSNFSNVCQMSLYDPNVCAFVFFSQTILKK